MAHAATRVMLSQRRSIPAPICKTLAAAIGTEILRVLRTCGAPLLCTDAAACQCNGLVTFFLFRVGEDGAPRRTLLTARLGVKHPGAGRRDASRTIKANAPSGQMAHCISGIAAPILLGAVSAGIADLCYHIGDGKAGVLTAGCVGAVLI